jgi:high-affinity Fe2+/Pb2+ permease
MNDRDQRTAATSRITHWLMLAVLIWGLLLALGTFRFGGNQPLLRAMIVVGCTLGFLGLWLAALAVRRKAPR